MSAAVWPRRSTGSGAEAQQLTNDAAQYERSGERQATEAVTIARTLPTSGDVSFKTPKLKSVSFETTIIERYRRRESSVEEALIEMCLVGFLLEPVLSVLSRAVIPPLCSSAPDFAMLLALSGATRSI